MVADLCKALTCNHITEECQGFLYVNMLYINLLQNAAIEIPRRHNPTFI
jgi:hypothetical protein